MIDDCVHYARKTAGAMRRRPNRFDTSLTKPPLGDGEDDGEAGGEAEGELPVTAETACDTGEATAAAAGEVTDDSGDDSAGAGPTPPAC